MKQDLDNLMQTNNLDALLIMGPGLHNPSMYYFTGGAHLTNADLIKKSGHEPILFHYPMERDEAAKTGLSTKNLSEYHIHELIKQCHGDQLQATVLRYQKMLTDLGITSGRIEIFGRTEAGSTYAVFTALQERMPNLKIVGSSNDSVLIQAMATKSELEIQRIRRMGQITTRVVSQVADFLSNHSARDGVLIKSDDQPLTIADVKARINLWLAEQGAENPEGTIFAIGRDAGVPHSSGTPSDFLRLGQTIIFDIFPCEAGGGYYYDFTRTWCLGYAPDDVQALYNDVLDVYQHIMSELKANTPCRDYQIRTSELFREKGHPTTEENPETEVGYVHSLGHGIGLHVHERPMFGMTANQNDQLIPGVVVTVEPGLYYPDRGMGVRLEDSLWIRPDLQVEVLADYPLDLVIPIKKTY